MLTRYNRWGYYATSTKRKKCKMTIRNENGLYIATFKHRDETVCMGYSPKLSEALAFCAELVQARDAAQAAK